MTGTGLNVDAAAPRHPLSVRPSGSLLLDDGCDLRGAGGLGLLAALPDLVLLQVLGCGSAESLSACAATSHALRAFSMSEELWRAKVLEDLPPQRRLEYRSSWRRTYMESLRPRREEWKAASVAPSGAVLYSDALFWAWHCGTASFPAEWTAFDNIARVCADSLSVDEFEARFETPGVPVILTGLVTRWAAFERWDIAALRSRLGDTPFHVSGHEMTLAHFLDYAQSTTDEQPLYLFDKSFAESAPALGEEYDVPTFFGSERDLFASLPAEFRPDHRWLIIGGARSGSLWHVDPNATSAWNGLVRGRKKWILCPPHAPPPGVLASADGAHVTSPLSLYEWYRVFYGALAARRRCAVADRPREAVVCAGELLFVPRGWWHSALNLEPAVAVTQNYAPAASARHVLRFLASGGAEELVSGVPAELRASMHDRLLEVIRVKCPEVRPVAQWPSGHARARGAPRGHCESTPPPQPVPPPQQALAPQPTADRRSIWEGLVSGADRRGSHAAGSRGAPPEPASDCRGAASGAATGAVATAAAPATAKPRASSASSFSFGF